MFDALSDRLERIGVRLRSRGRLSDADLDEALREIRVALLEADVSLDVVNSFVAGVRARCAGDVLSKSLTPGQQVVKAVREELVSVLGGETLKLTYASRPPTVVLLAGLQGAGKTTCAAKLARWWKQKGRNPILVGCDLQRPAAVEQLRVLAGQVGVSVFSEPTDPVAVARAGVEEARRLGRDVCIIDTAGRLTIDEDLMDEVRRISQVAEPHYTFLVVDAMSGQDAVETARAFHSTLALDGVILTKLDGDARGGAALSVKGVVGRPIVFASTGEKLGDFDLFHPDRMADRILGMGDVLGLIEQAESTMDREAVAKTAGRMMEGRFTLDDFLEQLQQVKKLGSIGGILKLLPGVSKEVRRAAEQVDDRELTRSEAIVRSMTPAERVDPGTIDSPRRTRIAKGSGTAPADVSRLLRQHHEMRKMVKGMASGGGLPGLGGGARLGGAPLGRLGRLGGLGGLGGLGSLGDVLTAGESARADGSEVGGDLDALVRAARATGAAGGLPGTVPGGGTGGGRTSKGKKKKGGRVTPPKPR